MFARAWDHASRSCRELETAARAAAREPGGSFGPATEALFDRIAASDLLARLVPAGRIPPDFARRCLEAARVRKQALATEAAALRAARRYCRLDATDLSPSLVERMKRLAADYPGEPEEGLAPRELALPGTPFVVTARGAVHVRETLPGTLIVVGAPLASRRLALAAARSTSAAAKRSAREAARRLARALSVVDAAWPEAGREIRDRTRLILPLEEPGLVSYSLLHRPGVTFINLRGKTLLDLADDLLHETAHHRLHAVEDATPLFPARSRGDELRYWSPWRRAQRPVRGIYHAAYTFSFRAELFRRIHDQFRNSDKPVGTLRKSAESARKVLDESRRERRLVARVVVDLHDAARRGRITAAGRRLLECIAACYDRTT